ncbi:MULTISPECIES: LLM class F420-dependent oxidoreductase [unclassified Nocardioides]|uniref:LLM class F420-dependent oxidoreductase n=1 Tax=unclassified Nocardioides TaxID=2615069 RepID=UPI002665CC92|nr:LLM class F420-dependent oxidoreductase [Nocardioides sp. Arc9.136]WKN50569.1 LLM class F420-dependent oxidoreductase [Nocardioides sp. Arc9.136]
MKLGVHYADYGHPGWQDSLVDRLTETARVADEGGISLFTVMDHWFQMEQLGGPAEPMLEGYTTLGYLAALTRRVRLGLLVTGVTYRHPGLLAKTVTTLDVLARGRAVLGIGAAWYEREHRGLGVPFPATAERFERLEETLQVVARVWGDDDRPFEGRHYRLEEPVAVPAPVRGRVPVLVGGSGERKTLRLVARYADACNLFGEGPDVVSHKLDVLRRHCDDVGRDPDEIEKTVVLGAGLDDLDGLVATLEQYAALGISLVTLSPTGDDPVAWTTELVERVLPRVDGR